MVFFRIGISYREFDPWMKNIESNVLSCERSQVVRHVYKAFETGEQSGENDIHYGRGHARRNR